jgi:hypothetical protein
MLQWQLLQDSGCPKWKNSRPESAQQVASCVGGNRGQRSGPRPCRDLVIIQLAAGRYVVPLVRWTSRPFPAMAPQDRGRGPDGGASPGKRACSKDMRTNEQGRNHMRKMQCVRNAAYCGGGGAFQQSRCRAWLHHDGVFVVYKIHLRDFTEIEALRFMARLPKRA